MLQLRARTLEEVRDTSVEAIFGAAVLTSLASLVDDGIDDDSLALPLSLSLVMRQRDISADDAITTLLALRVALVHAGGLDGTTEPVPLLPADPRTTLLLLARYLVALLARAAIATDSTAAKVAGVAASFLLAEGEPRHLPRRLHAFAETDGS
jgi:hypothetical protein